MDRSGSALPLVRSIDEVQATKPEPVWANLMADHDRVVAAARLEAAATYGSVARRKRHIAWKAAEARFAASLAGVLADRLRRSDDDEAANEARG